MQQLRRYRWIALALALWMSATVAAAALSPLLKNNDIARFALLCSSTGMKLVDIGEDGKLKPSGTGHNALDCPACLSQLTSAPPPSIQTSMALFTAFSAPDYLSSSFASRETLTPLARGPPSFIS
jgi:hypothetical protein